MSRFEYELTDYSPSFREEVAELYRKAFGSTATHLEWKYEQNPYLDRPNISLALHEGQVVGMLGMHGCQWCVGDDADAQIIPSVGDVAVDRAHRKRGLARRLLAYSENAMSAQGHRFVSCLSGNRATRLLQLGSSWRRVVRYESYRRGDAPEPAVSKQRKDRRSLGRLARARSRIKRTFGKEQTASAFSGFDAWARAGHDNISGTSAPRVAEMSELVSGLRDGSLIHHVRSEEFYQWRFADPRADSEIRFLFSDGNGGLEGFLVLHRREATGPMMILDWAASTPNVWSELMQAAIESNAEPLLITSTAFSAQEASTLHSLGFEKASKPDSRSRPARGLFVQALSSAETEDWTLGGFRLLDPGVWDVRMIHSDAF